MNDGKQNLATAVRDARTKLGLSQEKLATELSDCTEQEADDLLPFIHQLLNLLRKNA